MLQPSDGPDPETGNTYHFKIDGIYNQQAGGMTVEQVWDLVKDTRPDRLSDAIRIYTDAGSKLTSRADNLLAGAQKLVGGWVGGSAELALGQMKQLHETATNLAGAAQGVASALRPHVPVLKGCKDEIHRLLVQKRQLRAQLGGVNQQVQQAQHAVSSESSLTKVEDFFGRDDKQRDRLDSLQKQASSLNEQMAQIDRAAAKKLDELNSSSMDAYYALPDSVTKNLPPT